MVRTLCNKITKNNWLLVFLFIKNNSQDQKYVHTIKFSVRLWNMLIFVAMLAQAVFPESLQTG